MYIYPLLILELQHDCYVSLQGNEPLSNISHGSDRGSGFVREKSKPLYVHRVMGDAYEKAGDVPQLRLDRTQKTDPTEFLNMQHPNNYSSYVS